MPDVTAVISTFQRPEACERAVRSVLLQDPAPVEVLVCDDGSSDETPERFRSWELREPRVRYLRVEPNRGTPGPARNLGTEAAGTELIAYLDDDDEWLPGKLRRQLELAGGADVIGTDALRGDGRPYFGRSQVIRPTRREIVADNPMIASTAMAPRAMVLEAGGFITERWARGVADYAMWLALADRGARFAIAPEPLARYDSDGDDRMSAAPVGQELAVVRLAWRRMRAHPRDPAVRRAALNRTAGALLTAVRSRPRRPA